MELRQRIENDFLKRYIQDKTGVRSDNTRTRFTEAQKIRERRPRGNFTKQEAAVLKSEAKSANRHIDAEVERQNTVVDRIRKRRKAQEEYDKAARRLHKKEKEYWDTEQPNVEENAKDDASKLSRDTQIKEGNAEYEKEYEKWKRDFGMIGPESEATNRLAFWLKSTIGKLFDDGTNAHIGTLNGEIAEADIDIQAAEAHRQMSNLQRQKSSLQKEYLDYLGQLQDKQFLGQSITQDDENHLNELTSSLNSVQKQIDNTDLQQLDKMYKYQFARERGWIGGFLGARGQDIWDAISTTAVLASDEKRGKAQRRKQRIDEGVAAYDANIENYAEDYLNRKNAQSYTGVKTVSPKQKTKEEREDAVIEDYINGKNQYKQLRRNDIINTATLQQDVRKVFDVAKGYEKLSQAYQDDPLWSLGYWQYCVAGPIGSSNSSPSQLLANAAQTASMFASPLVYTATTLATTPLQIQGGLDENYTEISDKRVDNILAELEKPSNSKIAPYIIADLIKQSKLYWKGQGMDDAWIKEHTEGNNGINNVLRDLTSGAIHNNSNLIKEALLTSTKGLRAQRQADNIRTMWETGQQTMLQVMPIDKALSATFKLARNKAKNFINIHGSNAASGEINASIQSGVRNATHDASRYANGFRRGNTLDSFKQGYSAASEAAEAAGMGGAGSIYYGVLGGTTKASAHLLKKINPEFGAWANNVEEMLMHKYQNVIDKLTPNSGWSKLAVQYGIRAVPRSLKQALSEGSEEGVQYLNSKQDFASAYGYDGADFGELISNDMELGSRVASAYLSLLGMGKSELQDDQEFWNNVKGGFALGAHNPGVAQIGTMYSSIHGVMQKMGATEAITRFAVVNREQERLNRVSNVALAKEAMSGRGRAVIEELERMQQSDSRRETPRFQQEWYDEKIEDANRIQNLANDKGIRATLERNGIQYGTDRYAVAIADLYNLHRQAEVNNEEYNQNQIELDKAYQNKELNETLDKIINNDIITNTEFSTELNRAQSEAANKAQIALETEASQNGEDINSEEFKEIVDSERKRASDEVLEQFKNRRKKELIRNIRNLTQGKALLKIMAQSNSIKDVFDFIENKTGLKTKRPDAKIIEDFIKTKIKSLKSTLHSVDENFDENSTDEKTLEYLNNIEMPNANVENIEDLELASNMIAVDAAITKSYLSLLNESPKEGKDGSNSKYGRRVDAIIEANDRNEKLNWFVNDAYSGDAVNKLNDVFEQELRKEFEEQLKKSKDSKNTKAPSPTQVNHTSDNSTADNTTISSEDKSEKLKSKLSENKRKAEERIAKAKERYQRRKKKLHGGRLHMEIIPVTAIASIANDLFTAAEIGTYKIAQFITDLKDVLDSELNKETLDNAKRVYNTKAAKFKYKHPELSDNVSNADEIVNYVEPAQPVQKNAYIAPAISTIEPWKYIANVLSEKQKSIDNELSTYYDTIVVENDDVKIYTNTAEFESRVPSKDEAEYLRNLEKEIEQSNTSVEQFENKLEQLDLSKGYSKYRNVKGIYGVIARARLLQINQNNDSLKLAKRVRQFAIDCFLDKDIEQYSDIDPTGEHASKLKQYAKDCRKMGLYILSADNMIYANGKSSQLDLLLIDDEGNLHVIDVLQSIYEIHRTWNQVVRPMIVSKREREEKMFEQLSEILGSYKFNVVGTSVIPINCTDHKHITDIEDRIRVDVKKDESIQYNSEFYNDSVEELNNLIEDYNSLADECNKYDIAFAKINKFDAPKPVNDAENQQLCSTVSGMLEEVKMKYGEVTEKLKDAIETQNFVYSQLVPQFSPEEYNSIDNLNMLFNTCRDLDYMINMVPTGPVTTEREKTILNTFLATVQQAEDALNTVLQDSSIDNINIRQEQELIASAMEKIAKNKDYYGTPAVEVAKWWLTKFALNSSNIDDNQTASASNMQMLLNGYYDAIDSWTNVLREHILKDLDDDIILQKWYSTLLNNYFTKLIDNAQKVVDYLSTHKYTDPTLDVELPNGVQSVINNANTLIKEFNDSYGVDPDEIYSTPPKDKIEEINRMPITWNSPIGKSKSYSPAFDKMAGGMNQESKYRTWAMIYQKMSVNPDFLEKAYFEFSNDGDDIKVFIKYNGMSCYLPFITDLNSYPKGSISKDENIELHKLHLIKVTNKAKQKFISKIKAMLSYIKDHPEYRISVIKSLNKGSLIYNKHDQPKSLHDVSEFLFRGQNAKDLYTVRMSSADGIGFLIKKNVGTPRESWGVWCGENLQTPIREFDPEYIKDPIDFYNGAILFNFNTGNNQKIPALIDRNLFNKQEAESLASLIKMYIDGHDYVDGYSILDLLKMRLYLYDQHAVKSQCNNCGNIITLDRVNKQVIVGNESAYNVADKYGQLVQRLQKMPNMIDVSLINEQFMYSQFSVFSQMRSTFSNNSSLQKIELPNGLTVTRDDFIKQNSDGSRGTTWLGYLFRNQILATPVTGMSYKQINFSDPKLVLKEEVDSDEKLREDIQKKQEQTEKQTTVEDLISKMAASFLNMDVEASELVNRTDEQVSEFKKTAEEYFDTVFGSHDDLSIVSNIQSSNVGSRVAAGACAAQYVKLATNAPESAIFHEAFHKIIELVLPADQREAFYAMYRDKYGKDLSDRDVAEGLCDLFVDYMNLKMQHKRAKGFGKIYSWFKKVAFNIGMCIKFGLTNSIKFYQLHQDINRGKYANKQVSKENIDRFNSIFKTRSGISELYYTVENTDKKDSKVNFENITNAAELQDLAASVGFMIIKAYGLESIGADPGVIKVNENTPKMILGWLKKIKFTTEKLGEIHPALEEVFEEDVREVKIKGETVKQKYYPKFEAIQKFVSDYLANITGGYRGKFENLPENEAEDEDEAAQKRSNTFDRVSYEFSKLESATERAKFFLATIPYMNNDRSYDTTRNSMNFFSLMPIQEVFGTLIHETNDASSVQDLLQRLQRSAHIDAMHAYVYAKYKKLVDGMYTYNEDGSIKNIDYDKEAFAIQILNLLRGQDINFKIAKSITKSDGRGKEVQIINSSLERDSRQYPTEWTQFVLSGQVPILNTVQDQNGNYTVRNGKQDSFRNVANFFYDLIDGLKTNKPFTVNGVEYNQVDPRDLKYLKTQIIKQLYSIGILFPIKALEHLLKTKYSVEDESGDSFDGIKRWLQARDTSSIYPFLSQLEQFISKSGVVNKKLISKGYTNTGFVKELGNALGSYNRLQVQQMSLGLNGKKLYPVSQNSSISYIVSQLNTLNPENDLIHTLMNYNYVYDDSDGFPKGSILLKQILDKNNKPHFNLYTYIGFKTDNRGDSGVEYSEQPTIDDYVAKMAMLQNGYWVSSTLADKGTWVFMDGVKIPGMEFKQKELKNENDEVIGTTVAIDGIPTIQYVNNQYLIRPSNKVLDQMIEYAHTELLSIQQCMEDLGYENIPGYKKQGRPKLQENAKIKNYHTKNKSGVEPNGTRFLALTQVIVNENGKFVVKNLNDPNESSVNMLKEAYKYFFSKSLEEQRDIMTYILNARRADAVRFAEKIGLIERKEIAFTANGNTKVLYKDTDKSNTLFNLDSKHLNMDQVDALADQFMVQQGWDKIKHYAERTATREMCKSMAIAAILQDVTTRATICGEEMKRCFCGNPAFFKVEYDMEHGVIKDSTFDLQKRIGGLISTGDDNAQNLYGMSEEYVCAECQDYKIASDSDIAPRLEKMFKDSAVRETYAIITNDWKNAYEKDVEWIYEDIETTFSKDEKLRIENAIKNAKQFSDAYTDGINVADGAAYITDTMCENMLRKRGAYKNKVKKAFDILRSDETKYSWVEKEDAFKTIYDTVSIVATKYTAYGFRQHTLNGEIQSNLAVAYYNKFALFPLFPCLATGNMSGIYQKMLDEGVDMMFMDSAVKVGSQAPVKYDGNSISKPFNKYTQRFSFIRRQLNTDPEEGSTIAIGSQMVKIGLQNLRLDRTNYVHNGTGKTISGQELLTEFMNHIKRLSEIGVQNIIDKFFKDGTTDYNTGEIDPEKLSAYLKKELGSRNVNKSTIEAIDLTTDDHGNIKLKSPLAATPDSSWIESILISLINKFVININTPGSSFVQRSVFAIEAKDGEGSIQGADFYNGQRLQMINKDGSMDAVVSLDYFKDIIPKGLSPKEARQWLIDNEIVGEKAKATTIGYRIPTQAQSSIHALRFIDVLPATQATIILPSEFTKITGSDFDIDHLYLASYNYGKINETVVTGGDNFEVTVGLSKTEGLTEEQLEQNGLIDCMMTLLKDVENSINCLYRSIDNDTDLAQSLAKQLPAQESNKHLAYNFGTLHEQVERRNDYINGKKDIAPFALNATSHIMTYLFGVKFKDTKFTKFTGIWHLDHLVDDNDAYISSWLSAFINANVDIVKDPWVVRINVNPFTCNILNLLVRSGLGQTGVWFLCQPIIRELANVEERTKSNFSKDPTLPKYKFKQKLIGEVLDKYLIEHNNATISEYTTNSDAKSVQSRINVVNLILDNKEALRYIAVNPNATMVKLDDGSDVSVNWFQGQIYYAFLSLQKYVQAMNKLVQYTKIDTRKHGKNFIQIQRYLAMYNELFHPQDTSKSLWDLESLKRLADDSWIEYKTVNAINLPLRILANQVYTANPAFSSVVLHFARRLARSAGGEYAFTEDLINTLSNGLQTAIKARYMYAYAKQVLGRSDEYIRELFYGSSPLISIARRLNGLKYAVESVPEFERLKGNYIIDKLRPQPQQENVALSDGSIARQPQFITIDSNIDGSRTNENMMIDAWKDLLNDPNERVRMFAEDLILYTFFTTGESKGWNKLFKYVPPAWRRGEISGGTVDVDGIQCTSFSDYVEQTLNGRMPDLIPMLQEVVSNNFLNYGMCTTMQLKNEDGTANFINPNALSPVLITNDIAQYEIDSMPLYISIKIPGTKGRKASSYNLYKLTGKLDTRSTTHAIYTIVKKRGYSQFNNDIYEYGIDLQYKENETKVPNGSAGEIESRISDACEKIERMGVQGHKWTWDAILTDITGAFYGESANDYYESANDDIATDEQSSVPSNPSVVHQHKGVWTRSEVEKDTNSLYIFTDNTDRDSGSGLIDPNSRYAQKYGQGKHYPTRTQAVIRGLDNAMPISTQHWYHPGAKGPTGVWTDNDFEEFKKTIDAEIQDIIDEWNTGKYKRIVIGDGDAFFNSSISNISMERVPKLYSYLKSKVEELYRYVDEHKPESQPSQATTGIKYESDGGVSVEYTPTGKQRQTYTVKGNKIFNKNGDEVFKEDSVDRNKIFANLAVLQGRAVIVEHKGIKYVVNNRNQIISGATGKIMQWGEENGDRNAIIQAAEKRFKENGVKAAMEKSVHEAHKDVLNTLGGDEQAESEINSAVKTAVAGIALSEVLDKIEPVFTEEERAQITAATKDGKLQVMSVSRMTDPIFFTKEIIKFLEENAKKPFTDPTRVNAIEIWSKHDGMPMQDLLRACKKYKVAPMVSFSITGLGDTTLERGVMKYNDLIDRIEKLVQSGDLNPNTTTIRIDPILVGETNFEDVKTIVNRCKQIGIKKFVTSLVQSYGYLDGTPRDRKVVSGINEAMQRDGRTYDWDKYYGRVTNQDYAASKDFVQQYQNQHPKASWSEIVSAGAAQGVRVVTQSSIGKIHFIPKQEYIDEIGKILLEINKDPEIELETCSFFIKGLRASACLDPLIIERITGVDVTDENGRYNRDTSRPDCMCYGAHSDMFRMNEKKCFSSCAYCYAGKSDSNAISYYNEDGTLKDTIYTRTYEADESDDQNNELLQSATQPIKTEKTPKNYQKYIDVIQKYFDIGYTTGRIGKDDAKQVIQKLHIHIDENSYLFDAMKDNNLSETDLLNALYLLASHLDKPEVKGRTKLSDQQVDKLLDDMKNGNILTDVLYMTGGIYRIHESNDGLIVDTQLMSDLDFLLQNKKYEPIYQQLLNYMMNGKYTDEYYEDIVDIFNIDHEDLSGLIQVDSTFDNVNQLELFSDKDFEQGRKNKENCKGK